MLLVALLFLSIVVFFVDLKVTRGNMNVPWNGFGSIGPILEGEADQPMQYRVFVAWLCRLFGPNISPVRYLTVKYFGVLFCLSACAMCFVSLGVPVLASVAAMAVFLCFCALYDYADTYWEIGFLALCSALILNTPPLGWGILFVLTVYAALNRETAIFIPIVAAVYGEVWLAAFLSVAVAMGLMIPRWHYGEKKRYCRFGMVGENIRRLREMGWHFLNPYFHFLIVLMAVVYAVTIPGKTAFEWVMLAAFVPLLVPSIWYEIRVFAPCMLGVVPSLFR